MPDARSDAGDDLHALLFQAQVDPVFVTDPDGALLTANPAFQRLTRDALATAPPSKFRPFVRDADTEFVEQQFAAAATGETRRYTGSRVDTTGQHIPVAVTLVAVRDSAGAVVAIQGIARDASTRRAAQTTIEESEQRFHGLFRDAGFGITITDMTGVYVDANPAFLAMLGYTLEELHETNFLALTHPDDIAINEAHIRSLLAGEFSDFTFEKRMLTKSGEIIWVRANVSMIHDHDGSPLHLSSTMENITQEKLTLERLRRSERLQQLAGRVALVGGWSLEADTRQLEWSPEVYQILDAPDGAAAPTLTDATAMYPDEYRTQVEKAVQTCLDDGTPFDLEVEVFTRTGRRIPVRAMGEAERGADGNVLRVVGAFQDITELRRATIEAQKAAQRLTDSLESMTDAFFTLDPDWQFTFVNTRAGELLQRKPQDLIGKVIWDEFPEADGSVVYDMYHAAMHEQKTHEVSEFYFAPLDTWFRITAYPSERGIAVYFEDVSQVRRLRIERDSRESVLRRQAALLDEAQDAILVRDLDDRVRYWNAGAERLYGWSANEAVGADIRDLIYASRSVFDAASDAVRTNGTWVGDLIQTTKAGDEVTVAGRWTLIRDDDGTPEAILVINTDVTEQRMTERQLMRSQRMESIGTLAGGMAHDLNNVLAPILLAAELLQLKERPKDESEQIDTIVASARRGCDLVSQVLSFARGVDGERRSVDIHVLFAEMKRIITDIFPKNITIETDIEPKLPEIIGDATQLQQVLLNLVINARDAMPAGGTLRLRVHEVTLDDHRSEGRGDIRHGPYLCIKVEDTGVGMRPETRERIFEPFFTTKPHGSGTGLGLPTSAAIVHSHGGFISVRSQRGEGSIFRVYLPVDQNVASEPAVAGPSHRLPRGSGELILVVDDEAAVRMTTRQALEAFGYRVVEAPNGAEAVALFEAQQREISLVITDMMMPVMDGPAAIREILALDPQMRVIGTSGLHSEGRIAEVSTSGVRHFIPKPYTTSVLISTVADALAPQTSDATD